MTVHMTEVTRTGRTICRDDFYTAQEARTHYSRRSGKGFELVPFTEYSKLPLDWQIAQEAKEPEYINIEQDW